ncbi:MAG: hypothetical protein OXB95_07640 [Rhodobacteraceae bacterium]|nr:hypothetical protein [Paracoccaceae bacterium]
MKETFRSPERVAQILKVLDMVNGVPELGDRPSSANGRSAIFGDSLGPGTRHARTVVNVGSLPGNFTVEQDSIVFITPAAGRPLA